MKITTPEENIKESEIEDRDMPSEIILIDCDTKAEKGG